MLYRDYSRKAGEWVPNVYGGRENLEAIDFLRHLNAVVRGALPRRHDDRRGIDRLARRHRARVATAAWASPSSGTWAGCTTRCATWRAIRSIARYHHDEMTFGLLYAFSERFILPLSHDEVVHGKGSLLGKMPGDRWQRFANLRAYFGFMWAHPGKKLLFMGGEIAQEREWNHDGELDWHLLDDPAHAGMQRLVRDLNRLYRARAGAASRAMPSREGFRWIDRRRPRQLASSPSCAWAETASRRSWWSCNMTPVPRHGYRIGVPRAGLWREIFNTDAAFYGGSDIGNGGGVRTEADAVARRSRSRST